MHGAELVEVIGLVRPTACVEEGVVSCDEETALVHGDGVGTGKDCAGLTVFALTVGKEQGVFGREEAVDLGGLPHETVVHDRASGDLRPRGCDEVLRHHIRSDIDGTRGRTVETAVFEERGTVDDGVCSDAGVDDRAGVLDRHVFADMSSVTAETFGISVKESSETLLESLVVPHECHEIGSMGGEEVTYLDLYAPHLIEDGDGSTVTKGRIPLHRQGADIADRGVITDVVT